MSTSQVLPEWKRCAAQTRDGGHCPYLARHQWQHPDGYVRFCGLHWRMACFRERNVPLARPHQRADALNTAGVERFGTTWLAVHIQIADALRRTGVITNDYRAEAPLRLAAGQIAWQWCSDLEARDAP